ncbi:hypothetical protein [Streptomyces sp. NPDC052042]|uniref:DUF7848 domain-containing protein n=1 Tax=Streptomyces sp. NPDC052042 TaxID=3365683 RepID=UPI0037D8647D
MTVRTRYRFAKHGIGTAPGSTRLMSAACLTPGCGWTLEATADEDAGNTACMTHAGLNPGHARFHRGWSEEAEMRPLEGT